MKKFETHLIGNIVSSNDPKAITLQKKRFFGELTEEKVSYSLLEALYLIDKEIIEISSKNKKISKKDLFDKFQRHDKKLQVKYPVFKDLRDKGYIVKTALKFGAEFRVYDKGTKPGKTHAKWIVFTEHESKKLSWHEFSSKNRVAHSTRKHLLLAIVDEENKITYYEVSWTKP